MTSCDDMSGIARNSATKRHKSLSHKKDTKARTKGHLTFFCDFCAFLWRDFKFLCGRGRFCFLLSLSEVSGDGAITWTEDDDEDIGFCNIAYVGFFGAGG